MKINDWVQHRQDDILDEPTIELFRHYLREILKRGDQNVFTNLIWTDN